MLRFKALKQLREYVSQDLNTSYVKVQVDKIAEVLNITLFKYILC